MAKSYQAPASVTTTRAETPKKKTADDQAAGPLRRMTIEPTEDGGFIIECDHRPKPSARKSDAFPMFSEPEKYVAANVAELHTLLTKKFPPL